jgi:cell division protein FtsQ
MRLPFKRQRGIEPKAFRVAPSAAANRRRESRDGAQESETRDSEIDGAAARRPLRTAAKVAVAFVATGLVLWGGAVAYRQVTTADTFAVREIRVTGNSRLSETAVVSAAGVERGTNIFCVDVEQVAQRLKKEPWVLDAHAVRKLPRGLEIGIVERKLEALAVFDVPYLVDDSGVLFKRWAPGDPMPAPVISGLSREKLADDAEAVQAVIDDAVALTRRYRAQGLDRVAPLAEVHAELDGGFSLTIGAEPFYVRFGKGPYRQKLARLAALLRKLRADGEKPAIVYFDNEIRPDRVTVKVKPRAEKRDDGAVEITRAQ